MSWNIEGLLLKLKFQELITYLSQFDIFALSETWVQHKDSVEHIFPQYRCYVCAAVKNKSFGRAMAGLAVYVKISFCQHIKQICNDCDFAIFLQLDKILTKTDKDIIFCFLYIPPEASPFYENKPFKGISMLENQLMDIDINNVYLVFAGDLNARTASLSDTIQFKNNVPDLEEYDEIINTFDEMRARVSCDKTVNKFGKELINFCITYSLLIINSRSGEDEGIGNFTFVGATGNSVIDYIICSQNIFKYFKEFSIEERTESSHFPLSVNLETEYSFSHTNDMDKENNTRTKYFFNDETIKQFRDAISSKLTNEYVNIFSGRILDNNINVNDILCDLNNVIKISATCCVKHVRCYSTDQPKWFDNECKTLKAEKYRQLRQYRRTQSIADLEQYKRSRNAFKSLCDKKEKLYQTRQFEELVEAATNLKSFW